MRETTAGRRRPVYRIPFQVSCDRLADNDKKKERKKRKKERRERLGERRTEGRKDNVRKRVVVRRDLH